MALFSLVRFVARGENTLYGGFSSKSAFSIINNTKKFLHESCKQQIKINGMYYLSKKCAYYVTEQYSIK